MGKIGKFPKYGPEAERMYVEGKSTYEIARFLPVSQRTLERWRKEYDWDEKRRVYRSGVFGSVAALEKLLLQKLEELQQLPADQVDSKRIDSITKLVASIHKMKQEMDFRTQVVNVMYKFSTFIRQKDLTDEQLKTITELVQDFFQWARSL